MKNTKIYKAHYDYRNFDTNIYEYVEYIVNIQRQRKEQISNIVYDLLAYANSIDDMNISYQMFYGYLYDEGYTLSEIKEYYNLLKDILMEHNRNMNNQSHVLHAIDRRVMEGRIQDKKSWENAENIVDKFGATVIENDKGKKYVLTNAMTKERKVKK